MPSVDDILAHPESCFELPDGAVIVSAFVMIEWMLPGVDGKRRIRWAFDDDQVAWILAGALRFAATVQDPEPGYEFDEEEDADEEEEDAL